MNNYDIVGKPILTEKSYDGIPSKIYTFKVDTSVTKVMVKKAVEEVFGVHVEKVNTVKVEGKIKRRGMSSGKRPDYKKAIVKLKSDSKPIEFFESLS